MGDESNYEWDDEINGDNQVEINEARTGKGKGKDDVPAAKRRCVSSACIACRRRKSKVGILRSRRGDLTNLSFQCDGNLPSCAACSSVYHTPCMSLLRLIRT